MSSGFGAVGLAGMGVAINTTYTLAHHHDPFPTIMAGALFMGACVAVSSFNSEVGTALAGVYLLSTAITRGEYFVSFLDELVNSSPSQKAKNNG